MPQVAGLVAERRPEMHEISLKELQADAVSSTLKKGDRVVFDEMGGIWSPLVTLTGVIKKKNSDPIWMFDVEIDFPHLLGDSTSRPRDVSEEAPLETQQGCWFGRVRSQDEQACCDSEYLAAASEDG